MSDEKLSVELKPQTRTSADSTTNQNNTSQTSKQVWQMPTIMPSIPSNAMDTWQYSMCSYGSNPIGPANDFDVNNFINSVNFMPVWLTGLANGASHMGSIMMNMISQWGWGNMWNPGTLWGSNNFWNPNKPADDVDDGDDSYTSSRSRATSSYDLDIDADDTAVNQLIEERNKKEEEIKANYGDLTVKKGKEPDEVTKLENQKIASTLADSIYIVGTNEDELKHQLNKKINKDNIVEVLEEYLETTKNKNHNSLITDILDDYDPGVHLFTPKSTLANSKELIVRIKELLKERANTHVIKGDPNSPIKAALVDNFDEEITNGLNGDWVWNKQHDKKKLNNAVSNLIEQIKKAEDPKIQEEIVKKRKEQLAKDLKAVKEEYEPKIKEKAKSANEKAEATRKKTNDTLKQEDEKITKEEIKLHNDNLIDDVKNAATQKEFEKVQEKVRKRIKELREQMIGATDTFKTTVNAEITRLNNELIAAKDKLDKANGITPPAVTPTTPAAPADSTQQTPSVKK